MPLVIDVRNDDEFDSGHVAGALNIPPEKFMAKELIAELSDVNKDEQVILYCRTGSRSNVVAHIMADLGFTNVINGINQGHVEQMLRTREPA